MGDDTVLFLFLSSPIPFIVKSWILLHLNQAWIVLIIIIFFSFLPLKIKCRLMSKFVNWNSNSTDYKTELCLVPRALDNAKTSCVKKLTSSFSLALYQICVSFTTKSLIVLFFFNRKVCLSGLLKWLWYFLLWCEGKFSLMIIFHLAAFPP